MALSPTKPSTWDRFKTKIRTRGSSASIGKLSIAASHDGSSLDEFDKTFGRAHNTWGPIDSGLVADHKATGDAADRDSKMRLRHAHTDVDMNDIDSDLADKISHLMSRNEIGLQETGIKEYLPDEDRLKLVDPASITEVLGCINTAYIEWIQRLASKTFVITVLAIPEPAKCREAMRTFYCHNFTDNDLPIKKSPCQCRYSELEPSSRPVCCGLCGDSPRECESVHIASLDCFHHNVWSTKMIANFYKEQWGLLPQSFDCDVFKYGEIEDERLMPFLDSLEGRGEEYGQFATVQKARILSHYLRNYHEHSGEATIDIAIKVFKKLVVHGYEIKREWENEVEAHRILDRMETRHFARALVAFQHRRRYCLIFEWADGGNLRSHWNNTDYTGLSSRMINEYLHQFKGLTHALWTMHNSGRAQSQSVSRADSSATSLRSGSSDVFKRSDSRHGGKHANILSGYGVLTAEPVSAPLITVQNATEIPQVHIQNVHGDSTMLQPHETKTDDNWRHGDIKPDNILRFPDQHDSSSLGTLKLADFGRAKHHELATARRPVRERDEWRTIPYEPPDLYIDRQSSMSRLFDIWSLGCVIFETILLMLYGKEWLQDFEHTAKGANQDETPFWVRQNTSAKISPIVEKCVKHILEKDPECNGYRPSAMKDLLNLVHDKMLVVELPRDSDVYKNRGRANAEVVLDELNRIVATTEKDPTYLFTGRDRIGIERPPKLQRKTDVVPSSQNPNDHPTSPNMLSPGKSTPGRYDTYSNLPENRWAYDNDDSFARRVYLTRLKEHDTECLQPPRRVLCSFCRQLDLYKRDVLPVRKIHDLTASCALCELLLAKAKTAGLFGATSFSLVRNETGLSVQAVGGVSSDAMQLRLCRLPGKHLRSLFTFGADNKIDHDPMPFNSTPFIPMGAPILPEIGSSVNSALLGAWLEDCDNHHGPKQLDCVDSEREFCPKRLLDVGSSIHADSSHVVETKAIRSQQPIKLQYLALSHPWGAKTDQNPHFVSTIDNIEQHMRNVTDDELPQNFRDAVTVTRSLGIQYLWIDSVCILQATQAHPGDFQDEAGVMQDIFSSAYCVLAASSAVDMSSGFLHTANTATRSGRRAVEVSSSGYKDRIFICDSPDDFQHDVIEGPLYSRAWAFQERALARRTIFFSNNQIYWECSGGVRCESMSKLANSEAAFLGDSNFPAYVVKEKTKGAQIYLFKSLYADFCRLKFSHSTDKPFAIAGLEQRLTQKFADISGAGVFLRHYGRCLLWRREDQTRTLERINFGDTNAGSRKPPSWSFMAYVGGITYIDVPGRTVTWENLDLHLTGNSSTSWLFAPELLTFHATVLSFAVNTTEYRSSWLIVYDDPFEARENDKCVVIGTTGDIWRYILVVRPRSDPRAKRTSFERAGAGYIPLGWIGSQSIEVEIV